MVQSSDRFLEKLLPYLLQRASFLVTEQFHQHLKLNGVSVSRWRLLAWLSDYKRSTINELTDNLMLKQPTVTRLVDAAVKDGLVTKAAGREDGRRVYVSLTAAGEKLIEQLKSDASEAEAKIGEIGDLKAIDRLKKNLVEIIDQFEGQKYFRRS